MNAASIRFIVTHLAFHLDEAVALWLLVRFGEEAFPGISKATFLFWDAGPRTPDGRPAAEWEANGYVLVGVGGGKLDEHPNADSGRKSDECAATLVARALGVINRPELGRILKSTLTNDLEGGAQELDLASIIKARHAADIDYGKTLLHVFEDLDARYASQVRFAEALKELKALKEAGLYEQVELTGGRTIIMVAVDSDNPEIAKAARSQQGGGAALVIVRKATGHMQIFSSPKAGINMDLVAGAIRVAERNKTYAGVATRPAATKEQLVAEGSAVPGAENWHYFLKGGMLLNGSDTNKGVQRTRLRKNEVRAAVASALRLKV